MIITHRVNVLFVLALLTAAGCSETTRTEPLVAEPAEPVTTTLASTLPPPHSEPAQEKEREEVAVPELAEIHLGGIGDGATGESASPSLYELDGVAIRRLITAPSIEHREPVAPSSVFTHDEAHVYAFVEASNESDDDKFLWVHFIGPDGQVSGGIELTVPAGAPRWRTWARTRHAKDPGLWRVEIRTVDGALLGALPFEVDPGS